jgi:hypothetical protein
LLLFVTASLKKFEEVVSVSDQLANQKMLADVQVLFHGF